MRASEEPISVGDARRETFTRLARDAEPRLRIRVALNTRAYDTMRTLLADDVVFSGHPVRPDEPAQGITDVMIAERTSLSFAAPVKANEFYDVEVDGNTATLSLRIHNYAGRTPARSEAPKDGSDTK